MNTIEHYNTTIKPPQSSCIADKTIIDQQSVSSSSSCNLNSTESDSVHDRTSASSSSTSSSSSSSYNDDHHQNADCFVDASEELIEVNNDLDFAQIDLKTGNSNNNSSNIHLTDRQDNQIAAATATAAAAEAAFQHANQGNQVELKTRLNDTAKILRLALNNEFVKALDICGKNADRELYASLANAALCFIRSALTLETHDLQASVAAINLSFEVSSRLKRRTSTASLMMRFLYRPNYNLYTDDEIHAELVHAESLLLLTLISFISDQSLICLVRGAFRIRTCYQRYKELLYIMENRDNWSSDEAKSHFDSGVKMGHGVFNLLMSYLPPKVLRLLEYVGFSGNRTVGVEDLEYSVELNDGLRSVLSALIILVYHSYVEYFFGLGSYDYAKVEQINHKFLHQFPNSAFFLLFLGRYYQISGKLDQAVDTFNACIAAQNDWRQFHSVCHWETVWIYASQMNWRQAAHFSNLLRQQSKWSAASYTYQYGTFLYAQLVEDERQGLCQVNSDEYCRRMEEICDIMRLVPKLRVRYAGKTIPVEKFAITRAERFLKQSNRLTLPAIEFAYIWNVFSTLIKSPKQVEGLLGRIISEIDYVKSTRQVDELSSAAAAETTITTTTSNGNSHTKLTDDTSSSSRQDENDDRGQTSDSFYDDLALLWMLKGICLKLLSRFDEAEESFMLVIDNEARIKLDAFLVPHTAMELALLHLSQQKLESSKTWLRSVRQNYSGYLHEAIVHFRLHAASRLIRIEQQDLQLSGSTF